MASTFVRYFRVPADGFGGLAGAVQSCAERLGIGSGSAAMELRTRDKESLRKCVYADLDAITRLDDGFLLSLAAKSRGGSRVQFDVRGGRLRIAVTGANAEHVEQALDGLAADLRLEDARCFGLSLSGGGFRATLFHLGVIRFLADIGKLRDVTHLCSVSGGSILAAHLVQNWWRYVGGDFERAAQEIVDLVRADLRGRVFRRWIMALVLFPVLRWVGGSNRWCRTALLRREYDRLYRRELLRSLDNSQDPPTRPPRPDLYLLATAMKTGDMCAFTGDGLCFESGRLLAESGGGQEQVVGGALLPISLAVAASSAFPPVFPPIRVTHDLLLVDAARFPQSPEYLSDGGVYDNLGIRKLQHLQANTRFGVASLVVSDAEAPFVWQVGSDFRAFWRRAARSSDILMKRVADLELAWASQHAGLTEAAPLLRCSISEVVSDPEALEPELVHAARQIRTDLDRFSDLEIECLAKQGYMVAQKVIGGSPLLTDEQQQRVRDGTLRPWNPLRSGSAAETSAAGATAAESGRSRSATMVWEQVAELERSQRSKRRWVSAVFYHRDWATWTAVAALLTYLGLILAVFLVPAFLASKVAKEATKKAEVAEDVAAQASQMAVAAQGLAQQWESNFQVHQQTFRESWNFQIVYLPISAVNLRLDPGLLEVAALPAEARQGVAEAQRTQLESYERLKKVAGTGGASSQVCGALVSRHKILGDEEHQLFSGFVKSFRFPGSDAELLIEFSGRLPTRDARRLPLEFYQYKLSQADGESMVATFQVDFQKTSTDDYEGPLQHPLLQDKDGRPLDFATVRLWKTGAQ